MNAALAPTKKAAGKLAKAASMPAPLTALPESPKRYENPAAEEAGAASQNRPPLANVLITELRMLRERTFFAFKGVDGSDSPGTPTNGLLDMATDYMDEIIANLESATFDEELQGSLLFDLGRFEHLICGAIGVIEREQRFADEPDVRESVRLEHLDALLERSGDTHNNLDVGGKFYGLFKEAGDAHPSCDVGRWRHRFDDV